MGLVPQIDQELIDKDEMEQTSCIVKDYFDFEFIFVCKGERIDFMEISRKRIIFPTSNNEETECIMTKYGCEMRFR